MRTSTLLCLLILLMSASLVMIAACSGQKDAPVQETKEHGVTDTSTATGISTAFEDYCTDCHEGARALGRARNIDEWKAVTRKMAGFRETKTGETIPEEAQQEIIDYLLKESR